ncbi:hypothetical protein GCM10023212_25360 [Luteolibacter yonseiensis]
MLVPFLAPAVFLTACKPAEKTAEKSKPSAPVESPVNHLATELAGARIDVAKTKLDQKRPDEALSLLVTAIKADPASGEARSLIERILLDTVWNLPELTIDHKLPIGQIHTAGSSAWVSLEGGANTTLRWNLDTLKIESVLFPAKGHITRSLVFDGGHRRAVVQRGPVTLLCDAVSLEPICDLGPLPDDMTPASVISFSPDGLLMAHPAFVSEADHSIVWKLRDSATGQIIRTSDPVAATAAQPLAAWLDRQQLRVIHSDGSLTEMPVSPVEEIRHKPMAEPVKLLQAQFSTDGNSVLTLQNQGSHQPPVQAVISYQGADDGSLEERALINRFPWSLQPNIWTGLMADPQHAPFFVEGKTLEDLTGSHALLETGSDITAAAFDEQRIITGEANGMLTVHRLLPLPTKTENPTPPPAVDTAALTALENLSEAFAGIRYDEKDRTFTRLSLEERMKAFAACREDVLNSVFPGLDFTQLMAAFEAAKQRTAPAAELLPLWDRLTHADASGKSWQEIIGLSQNLAAAPWHEQEKMEEIFRSNDSPAILAAIKSAGGKGPAAATALALALKSDIHEWIDACLTQAKDLPPLLRRISLSRIAWLQGRKADALSVWPEVFPVLADVRLREDWDGWEQADFQPALDNIRGCVNEVLATIRIPENAAPEERKAVAERLADPATVEAVGKRRFGEACLQAALAFSIHKEEAQTTFQLASTARELGVAPEPCIRAEAMAQTVLGDYAKAHELWIELITEHPVETTIPGDYAEAAYTAFENMDPKQAMEILTAGMHRFPEDGNFAIRAGWVALLTGNSERAYQFLLTGKRIGFPAEKLENATALLTIAAAQSDAQDDAAVYFQDLLRIDKAWADTATLDTLDWPEELKFTLGQFMR